MTRERPSRFHVRSFRIGGMNDKLVRLAVLVVLSIVPAATAQSPTPITVRAARLLDGRGGSMSNVVITVQGSKIVSVDRRQGPVTHELGDVTLLPGLIDVHVHLNWYFGPGGKYGERNVPPAF